MKILDEFKELIPALTDDEYTQLEKNILQDGIRDPLVLWGDILVDGHNRLKIAKKHGLTYNTVQKEFTDKRAAEQWIILNQFGRRNISAYERARLALRLKPIIAEQAKENEIKSGLMFGKGLVNSPNPIKPIDTRKEIAQIAGIGEQTISRVEYIEHNAPAETREKLSRQEISINQAYQETRRDEKVKAVCEKVEQAREEISGGIDIFSTENKYNIIYADPPWEYWAGGQKNQNLHYNTMTIEQICELPIKDIADKDCVLFLWVTYPILDKAFDVIRAWGFEYSTAGFVWVKKNKNADTPFIGCGSWTRANSELCLIATKGNNVRLDASISQVIESPIDEHSRKPALTRELITRLLGELPRIELFSRNNVDGWDCWGNEI